LTILEYELLKAMLKRPYSSGIISVVDPLSYFTGAGFPEVINIQRPTLNLQ